VRRSTLPVSNHARHGPEERSSLERLPSRLLTLRHYHLSFFTLRYTLRCDRANFTLTVRDCTTLGPIEDLTSRPSSTSPVRIAREEHCARTTTEDVQLH
jgi:hypothetical protein